MAADEAGPMETPGALGHADDDGGSPPRPGWDDMSPAASHNQPPPR